MVRSHGETGLREQNRKKPGGTPWKPGRPMWEEWPRSCNTCDFFQDGDRKGGGQDTRPEAGSTEAQSPDPELSHTTLHCSAQDRACWEDTIRTTSWLSRRGNQHHGKRRSKYKRCKKKENLREQAAFSVHYSEQQERERCELPSRCSEELHSHTHAFCNKTELKHQNNIPTGNESTRETHTQKTDGNATVRFWNGLKDMKEHKSTLEKLRYEVTELKKVAAWPDNVYTVQSQTHGMSNRIAKGKKN